MNRVFAISETFYDILIVKGKPIAACPGGSMLNCSVSLGRAGIPVSFISEFAHDKVGDMIHDLLVENNVATKHLFRFHGNSPLALAFLDHRNEATYQFYDEFPQERLIIEIPDFASDDIVMFGSILSVTKETRKELESIIHAAKDAGSTIIYDPNFRRSQLPLLHDIKPMIMKNISYSDIVRASHEDMRMIHGCSNAEEAYGFVLENGCDHLMYTTSSEGVHLKTPLLSKYYKVPTIETVSTVGAGDNFDAGLAYMLYSKGINSINSVSESNWDEIIRMATDFASHVCMSTDNYISNTFASGLKKIEH
ncbi:PfkB family carbohydrate kinase [Methanolobus profundi]|uniref:Fructokinase n=1 Tax=Methanolobus profundi TaxID=487685 RepID=A0A1I4R2D3_9EURY|nr:PfkB family carbohydrate kinase [Methanolobus profundi]SFM46073.1 fructokinase [Methanolobus profundi]